MCGATRRAEPLTVVGVPPPPPPTHPAPPQHTTSPHATFMPPTPHAHRISLRKRRGRGDAHREAQRPPAIVESAGATARAWLPQAVSPSPCPSHEPRVKSSPLVCVLPHLRRRGRAGLRSRSCDPPRVANPSLSRRSRPRPNPPDGGKDRTRFGHQPSTSGREQGQLAPTSPRTSSAQSARCTQ